MASAVTSVSTPSLHPSTAWLYAGAIVSYTSPKGVVKTVHLVRPVANNGGQQGANFQFLDAHSKIIEKNYWAPIDRFAPLHQEQQMPEISQLHVTDAVPMQLQEPIIRVATQLPQQSQEQKRQFPAVAPLQLPDTVRTAPVSDRTVEEDQLDDGLLATLDSLKGKFATCRERDVIANNLRAVLRAAKDARMPMNSSYVAGRRAARAKLNPVFITEAHKAQEIIDNLYTKYRQELARCDELLRREDQAKQEVHVLDAEAVKRKREVQQAAAKRARDKRSLERLQARLGQEQATGRAGNQFVDDEAQETSPGSRADNLFDEEQ